MSMNWDDYSAGGFYDELISPAGNARQSARRLLRYLKSLSSEEIEQRKQAVEATIREMGVTFTVYTDEGNNIERSWPFDMVPRTISKKQWDRTALGLSLIHI